MSLHPAPRHLLLLLCLVLAACGKSPGEESTSADAPAASLAVSLVKVQPRTIERTVIASGPVTAWEEMQLGVEVSGLRVTTLHVDVGQSVKKGQVLLQLDARVLQSDWRSAKAAHAEAEAGVQLAKINLSRGQNLAKEKLISASALDELRAGLVQAEAREATSRAALDAAQLRLDFTRLRAPDDGIISRRLVQPGQVVMAGGELLRLIRQGRLEWRAELAESELGRVQPGAVVLLTDGNGQVIEGRVRAVSPGLDATTRTGTLYADLPAPGALKTGMFVEGRVVTGSGNALMLPAASVVRRDGHAYVFTVGKDGIARRVRIRLGSADGDWLEVLEGLEAGDAVVARGAGFLGDGDSVRVVAGTDVGGIDVEAAGKAP